MLRLSTLAQATPSAAMRGRSLELLKRFAQQLVPRGSSLPLTVSLAAHLGLIAVAVRHAQTIVSADPALAAIEMPAPDLERTESAAPELPAVADVAVTVRSTEHQAVPVHVATTEPAATAREIAQQPALAPDVGAGSGDTGPRFVMTVAATTTLNSGPTFAHGVATGSALEAPAPIAEAAVETPARLKLGNAPSYTAAALSAGIEADVPLEIVVNEAGTVTSARGVEHVGYGLDEAALQSVRSYRFTPALQRGKAVAVRMRWLMRFQLR
jgi:protein TonB